MVRTMGEDLEAMFVDVAKPADVIFVDPYIAPGDHTGFTRPPPNAGRQDTLRTARLRVSPNRAGP